MSGADFQLHTIAAGFMHSATIDKRGSVFVWGDNSNQQLKYCGDDETENIEDRIIDKPTEITF